MLCHPHCPSVKKAVKKVDAECSKKNGHPFNGKPFSEGELIKMCMVKTAEIVYPEKQQAFLNISLTTNTIADRISDLSVGLDSQLKNEGKGLIAFSVAIDEDRCFSVFCDLNIFKKTCVLQIIVM